MRGVFALFCTLFLYAAYGVDVEPGTHVLLRLEHSVSAQTAQPGDYVHFRTASPVRAIPIGSGAVGVITRVSRARLFRKNAELEIRLVSITLTDGSVVRIAAPTSSVEPPPERRWRDPRGAVLLAPLAGLAAGGVTGARVGTGVGIAWLLLSPILARGHGVELRQGSALDAVIE